MKIEKVIKQLESILDHTRSMAASPDADEIWKEDSDALEFALTALCSVSRVQELEAENKELKERIVNWRKYMAPAHIDRRAWTAEWVPTTDDDGCVWLECSACEYDLDSMEESNPFCPSCGRAMTEEACAKLERRLRLSKPPEED